MKYIFLFFFPAALFAASDLRDVYAQALKHAYGYNDMQIQKKIAESAFWQSVGAYFPKVDAELSYIHENEFPIVKNGAVVRYQQERQEGKVTVSQMIYDDDVITASRKANNEVSRKSVELGAAEQTLLMDVTEAYFDFLEKQDKYFALKTQEKTYLRIIEQAKLRLQGGLASRVDVLEAEAKMGLLQIELHQADTDLKVAMHDLSLLVGREVESLAGIDHRALGAYEEKPLEEWISEAEEKNADISIERSRLRDAVMEEGRTGRHWLPKVYLDYLETKDDVPSMEDDRRVSVSMRFNLLKGGSDYNGHEMARLERLRSENKIDEVKRQTRAELEKAYIIAHQAKEGMQIYQKVLQAKKRWLEAARKSYGQGLRTLVEVMEAESEYIDIENKIKKLRYDYIVSGAKLLHACASLQPDVFTGINLRFSKGNEKGYGSKQSN